MLSLKVPTEDNYRITPLSVCSLYLLIKLHFQGKYDAIKYNWKYGITNASFNSRRDKRFFERIAYKYTIHELTYLFVSSFLMDTNDWIGGVTSEQAGINYRKYDTLLRMYSKEFRKEVQIILALCVRDNLKLVDMFSYDKQKDTTRIFSLLKMGIIKYETFLILDRMLNLIERSDVDMSDNYEWLKYSTVLKAYRRLLIIDEGMSVDIFVDEVEDKLKTVLSKDKLLNKMKLNGDRI